jgi:enoyl-CoA hydratase/carnithine racemase
LIAEVNTTPIANAGQIRLEQRSPFYWRVTFDIPPVNIFGPKNLVPFNEIITKIETDEQLKVVVFDSAIEGFFLTHWDFLATRRLYDVR